MTEAQSESVRIYCRSDLPDGQPCHTPATTPAASPGALMMCSNIKQSEDQSDIEHCGGMPLCTRYDFFP
jgi:hypothetical protein